MNTIGGNFDDSAKYNYQSDNNTAQNLDNWNGEENYEKAVNGQEVEDFKMFDFNPKEYSQDLKDFAQQYIDLHDTDKDKNLSFDEFVTMALENADVPDELKGEFNALFKQLYSDLNLDEDKDKVSAEEFASQFYISDLDLKKFAETDGNLVQSLDGKLDFVQYNLNSNPDYVDYDYVQDLKEDFYKHFYE